MHNDTATLVLNGEDVPLRLFEDGVSNFRRLLESLSREISGAAGIEWVIDRLETGSALTRVRAEAAQPEEIEAVLRGFLQVGRALQLRNAIPYSGRVRRPAQALAGMLNGRVTSLRFETPDEDVIIQKQHDGDDRPVPSRAFGAVMGRIQTLSSRRGYTFTLYDSVFDKAVTCYLRGDQEDLILDKWDRRTIIEGIVSRDPETDRPLNIRDITDIVVLPEHVEGVYLPTLSDVPSHGDDETTDVLIRRLRDAW